MKWLAVLLLSYRWDNHALHIYQVLCSAVTIYLKQERRKTFPEFFIGRSLVLATSPIIKYRKKTKKEPIIIVNCETRKVIIVIRDLPSLIAVNCGAWPPLRPLYKNGTNYHSFIHSFFHQRIQLPSSCFTSSALWKCQLISINTIYLFVFKDSSLLKGLSKNDHFC